jgi:hypothetical protein
MFKEIIKKFIQKLFYNEPLPPQPKYEFPSTGDLTTNKDTKEIKTLLVLTKKLHDVLVVYNAAGYAMKWKTDKVDKLLSESKELIKQFEQIETIQPSCVQNPVTWNELLKEADQIVRSKSVYKKFIDGTPLENDIAVWMASFAQKHNGLAKALVSEQSKVVQEPIAFVSKDSLAILSGGVNHVSATLTLNDDNGKAVAVYK